MEKDINKNAFVGGPIDISGFVSPDEDVSMSPVSPELKVVYVELAALRSEIAEINTKLRNHGIS